MDSVGDPKILKKIYFIKRADEGEELVTLLKNKFKIIDAIRDLLRWNHEGRDFAVSLRHWPEGEDDLSDSMNWLERSVQIHQHRPQAHNNRDLVTAIKVIIDWLDEHKSFDITLAPMGDPELPFEANFN